MAATIPIFDGMKYKFWKVKMKTLFKSRDLWDTVENGYDGENDMEKQKKNAEALSLIQQGVSDWIFEKIMGEETAKVAWDFLQRIFETEERPTLPFMRRLVKAALAKALFVQENISNPKETNLIVATLIATVTFAAGFTMPGGYINDNKDPNQGMAILTRKAAFKAFVITDTIALTLSVFAVLTHHYKTDHPILLKPQLATAFLCTYYAIMAMSLAFITGTYAVLAPSRLSISVCVIPSVLSVMYLYYREWFFQLLASDDMQRLSPSLSPPSEQNP